MNFEGGACVSLTRRRGSCPRRPESLALNPVPKEGRHG